VRALYVALVLLAAFSRTAQTRQADLASLPACPESPEASMRGWIEEPFDGVVLRLPADFRAVEPQAITDHGGKAWTNGRLGASLTKGYYGLGSFDFPQSSRCRVTGVDGRHRLVMTSVRPDRVWVMVFDPSLNSGGLQVTASAVGTAETELPVLRSIVLSVAALPT
jgi:hypothetical protein